MHMGAGAGPQSLPREVTFNPVTRQLEQPPLDEAKQLRGPPAFAKQGLKLSAGPTPLRLSAGVAKQSEFLASFVLPDRAATFGFTIGAPSSSGDPPGMAVGRLMNGFGMSGWCEKRISFAPFYTKTDHFTKTGSGQTYGDNQKEMMRFSPQGVLRPAQRHWAG